MKHEYAGREQEFAYQLEKLAQITSWVSDAAAYDRADDRKLHVRVSFALRACERRMQRIFETTKKVPR